MSDGLAADQQSNAQVNPLVSERPPSKAMGRVLAAGAAGALVTASTLLGAGTANAAGSAVIEQCTGSTDSSEFGQRIVASPAALDAKVEQAVLLAFPLQFDLAKQAKEEFSGSGSVGLGTVGEETRTFSGQNLADAFAGQIEGLSGLQDKGSEVSTHVRNLAALGCIGGARVPGQEQPPPPPPEPAPEPEEPSEQPAPPSAEPGVPADDETSAPVAAPGTPRADPRVGTSAPVVVVPPNYGSAAPGTLPPWAQSQFGAAPGFAPNVGDLREQAAAKQREQRENAAQQEVRAAGKAETLPAGQDNRVALPVLIAAISLAGVTAALVRTWVLRRA